MPAITFDDLSKNNKREVTSLKRPIADLSQRFGVVRQSIKEIAPRVIRLFTAIKAEHEQFTFVDFARLFAPDLPTFAADKDGATGYRNHKTYAALSYMQRLVNLRPRGQQGVRDTAVDTLARTLATILQVMDDPAPVWQAVQTEFAYGEGVMTRLKKRVENTRPLFELRIPRAGVVRVGHIIHMDRTTSAGRPAEAPAGEVSEAMVRAEGRRRPGRPRKNVAA